MNQSMPGASSSASPPDSFYEDGRRRNWTAPVVLAGAGWCAMAVVVFAFLILPQLDAKGRDPGPLLPVLPAVLAVVGVVLAVVGMVTGLRRARRDTPVYLGSVTAALAVIAILAGMAVASYVFVLSSGAAAGSEPVFSYMIALCTLIAVALVALCVLRVCRARAAAVLTPAFALIALLLVPFGTVAGLAWLVWARKRETSVV